MIFDIGRPLIMAHRGESGNVPENTMLALESALKIGVDVLESDIRFTKDNIPILFHDDDLERTTGVKGSVRDKTLDELLQIDLGYSFTTDIGQTYPYRGQGLKVVTLEEALQKFPDTILNLDIKDTFSKAPKEVARVLQENQRTENIMIASFHPPQLKRFRESAPMIPTSAHPNEVRNFVIGVRMRTMRFFVRSVAYKAFQIPERSGGLQIVTPRFVTAAHERDLAVHVWTINDKEGMERLLNMEVNGIFTDYPTLLREVLSEHGYL
ncbi:MAG: glycerophosphodiester phosphodiesterase [Candidatus Thorarchaeota archaeon]